MPYNSLFFKDSLTLNTDFNPDVNFFQNIFSLKTKYFSVDKFRYSEEKSFDKISFSELHLNIKDMTKKIKCLKS